MTENLNIHGFSTNAERYGELSYYGSDAVDIQSLMRSLAVAAGHAALALALLAHQAWLMGDAVLRTLGRLVTRPLERLSSEVRALGDGGLSLSPQRSPELPGVVLDSGLLRDYPQGEALAHGVPVLATAVGTQ